MRKTLLGIIVVVFVVAVVADQSWAMGKRSRGGSSNSGSQSSGYNDEGSTGGSTGQNFGPGSDEQGGSGDDLSQDNPGVDNSQENTPGERFYESENSSDEQFPTAATVPEPATMTLLGMGMAAALLRRRKK